MTKTNRVNLLLMIFLMSSGVFAEEDLSKTEEEHADRVNKACDLRIKFDLHDFEYGRDEAHVFSNLHFEDTSLIAGQIADACKANPVNRKKLERIGTIIIKRGSMDERKLIQRKNGDLVYLSARTVEDRPKGRSQLVHDDLVRVLGLNFEKASDIAKKVSEKKSEDLAAKKSSDRDKKIADLTAWFQGEVKKGQSLPPAEIGPRMNELSKQYEEKLNAIINTP